MALPTDVLAVSVLSGEARGAAIRTLVDALDLDPANRDSASADTNSAGDAYALSRSHARAVDASADARIRALRSSLAGRRGAQMALLLPPAFSMLTHRYRLGDDPMPFDERLRRAYEWLKRDLGEAEAFERMAGLPVEPPVHRPTGPQSRAPNRLTPFERLTALRADGRAEGGADEASFLGLVEGLERWGGLAVALLDWTHARLTADDAWRRADRPLRFATTWLWAGELLAAFVRAGLAADGIEQTIRRNLAGIPHAFRLASHEGGLRDQSAPYGLSREVLAYHLLGAASAGGLVGALGDATMARARSLFTLQADCVLVLEVMNRDAGGVDCLAGWMTAVPDVLMDGILSGAEMRTRFVVEALRVLETDAEDFGGWLTLGAVGRNGLDEDAILRYSAFADSIDIASLPRSDGAGQTVPVWRLALPPLFWPDRSRGLRHVRGVALACRRRHPGAIREASPASDEVIELLEAGLLASAGIDGFDATLFCAVVRTVAESWPAALPILRGAIRSVLVGAAPTMLAELWTLDVDLRRFA